MESYNIEKNSKLYYVWTIRYDRYLCAWSDLSFHISSVPGSGGWIPFTNYRFLQLTYHSKSGNNSSQPSLPSDLNYPNTPSSKYVETSYYKWRIIKSDSYNGEPFLIDFVNNVGDDLWRKVTPYEYELIQSNPMFCSVTPQPPSFANTVFKYDSDKYYRKFKTKWSYSSGSLNYISGPIYVGYDIERGNSRWVYNGDNYSDPIYGTIFEFIWVSREPGYGTSPNSVTSNDLIQQISSIYNNTVQEESILPITSINIETAESVPSLYNGYPVFRVVYDFDFKSYSDIEIISIDENDNQKKTNNWHYVSLYEQSNILKAIFYFYSSDYYKNLSLSEVNNIPLPSLDNIDLKQCPYAWIVDRHKIMSSVNFINVFISNVEGEGNIVNGEYRLSKEEDKYIWSYKDSLTEVALILKDNYWDFSLSSNYKDNNYISINKNIDIIKVFVGNLKISFSDNATFKNEIGSGQCSLSFNGDILENKENQFSSSSSSSSS